MNEPIRVIAASPPRTEDYLMPEWSQRGMRTGIAQSPLPTLPDVPPQKLSQTEEQVAAMKAKAEAKRKRKAEKRKRHGS